MSKFIKLTETSNTIPVYALHTNTRGEAIYVYNLTYFHFLYKQSEPAVIS